MVPYKRLLAICLSALLALAAALPIGAQTQPLRDLSGHRVDDAQLRSALASRTMTWLTGTSANNDYISVGRMANFFGFVALRVSSGQSLTRAHVARDTLATLDPDQIDTLAKLLTAQAAPHARTQEARIAMNRALEGLRVGEGVSEDEFLALGRTYGAAEAELGRVIAEGFGQIAATLTPDQRASLMAIRLAHASGQPDTLPRQGARPGLPDVDRQELVNLAARFLSWTTGTPEDNDFEVVGKPSQHFGFVSLRLASGHSVRRGAVAREVRDLFSADQKRMLERAVDHNTAAFPDFLAARAALMRALEVALEGRPIDPAAIETWGRKIGGIEAQMTWAQAQAMLALRQTLSAAQRDALFEMRARYTSAEADSAHLDPVSHGRQLFAQCVLCHGGAEATDTRIAPRLASVIGRAVAAAPGYRYSPALSAFAGSQSHWTLEALDQFLTAPRRLVPGTTMGFDGLSAPADRAALLAYIATLD